MMRRTISSVKSAWFPEPPTVTTSGVMYLQALREDSLNRFYTIYKNDSVEQLINDFNLQINDTFPNSNSCTIYKIDTVYLGSSPLKRFQPQSLTFGQGVIEGIGNTGPICGIGIEGNESLICFHKQNDWMQLDSSYSCSAFPIPIKSYNSISESYKFDRIINLFPNPAYQILHVESGFHKFSKYLIFNSLGMVVANLQMSNNNEFIDISKFKSGVYYIQLSNDKGWKYTSKFIIE